jgi:hypothetical protein
MMCEELSTAIGPPPLGRALNRGLYVSLLNNIQSPELGVGPQRYILPYRFIIKRKLSVCSRPVIVKSSGDMVKIGDGSTFGGGGVGLGLGLGSRLGLDSMLKFDSGSDGEADGSGSDLHHGAHRATKVTTSRTTSWESPRGLDRRRIQQKSNEWRTSDDARPEAAPVCIDASAWCVNICAPPLTETETGEHSSFARERTKHRFREFQMYMDICTSLVCTKKLRPAFTSRIRSHEVTPLAEMMTHHRGQV